MTNHNAQTIAEVDGTLKPELPVSVDILVPSYRGEKYLPLCLACLGQSSWRHFQVHVSIDGPCANRDQIEDLARYYNLPVTLEVTGSHVGLAENRRRLLRPCTSKTILWIDDDVLVSPDTLERLLQFAPLLGSEACAVTGVASKPPLHWPPYL